MASAGDKPSSKYKKPMGTYIPPAKRVKAEKFEIGSEDYQRAAWDDNKKKITGLVNRASSTNLTTIVKELFKINLIRYKGLFASALLKAQETSPVFTDVYAALLAVINSRINTLGQLVVNRLVLQYRIAFKNNNKPKLLVLVKFIAHLTNQDVVYEVLGFQLVEHLLSQPTPVLLEILITFLRECGAKLEETNGMLLFEAFRTLRHISLENDCDTRTQELIDQMHMIRKGKFREYPAVKRELDLVEEDDRVTHEIALTNPPESVSGQSPKREDFHMEFNYFKFDPNWSSNEAKYEEFIKSLFDDEAASTDDSSEDDEDIQNVLEDSEDKKPVIKEEQDVKDVKQEKVVDETGADLIAFRRMVYLTIRSSVRHEEVVHKLLKSRIAPELHDELCQMILDCCGQERTYEQIYGLVASKFCQINRREFAVKYEKLFAQFYEVVYRFETNKIRNIAKFYAHLLTTESIDWTCLSCLKLRENATSSAGRCFIKFLFQELVSTLSMAKLIEYINDPDRQEGFKEIFPTDQEQDTRFAINFFTFSNMGQLTESLRQQLLAKQD